VRIHLKHNRVIYCERRGNRAECSIQKKLGGEEVIKFEVHLSNPHAFEEFYAMMMTLAAHAELEIVVDPHNTSHDDGVYVFHLFEISNPNP
jgi:hypothetical protein